MGQREAFERMVGDLEYPMFIVTACAAGEPLGCLVGFTTQASIDPPRFAVCLSHANRTFRRGRDSPLLGVHAVPADAAGLAELFGGETGDDVDKFARCAWHAGPDGVPILDRCENWFVGRVLARLDAGDHDVFLLEPIAGGSGEGGEFSFHRAKRIDAGHEA
jgi:flavin reductase (DIM6/NTAB) family NADH-FMN oxidoreductase RutF